jgi:cysteinyl-tRNA synthetase
MIRINGEKMSKSLNNFFTIRDVLDKYHPEVVRYLLVASHYRSAINYSEDNLRTPRAHWSASTTRCAACRAWRPGGEAFVERFTTVMNDDFGTPKPAPCCSRWCARSTACARAISRRRPAWPVA